MALHDHEINPDISIDNYGSFVCAITIGGTYSGYAFSRAQDIDEHEMDITVQKWNAPSHVLDTYKTPTSFLVDSIGRLEALGYEADSKYAELVVDERRYDNFYFGRALLDLAKKVDENKLKELNLNTPLKDITNRKKISAIDVFCHLIKFFRDHMMNTVDMMNIGVSKSDIKWVLTVPAMWSSSASRIINNAAEIIKIPREQVVLALESEAALLYCNRIPRSKLEGQKGVSVFEVGKKILLLDAGGGKVDFTVFEITKENILKTLEMTSDRKCGGTCVDNCYEDALIDVVGIDDMNKFCQKFSEDYIELLRNFEINKRTQISETQAWVTMRIPETLHKILNQEMNEAIKRSKHSRNMKLEGKKLRVTSTLFMGFFDFACKRINENIVNILKKPELEGLDKIVMIGGFSMSPILQKSIKENFPLLKVFVPDEANLVVLKGAVLYGHNLSIMPDRIAKNWYCVASRFDKSEIDCGQDEFKVYVRKGEILSFNKVQFEVEYKANCDEIKEMEFNVYVSEQENLPKYVTDQGFQYLGTLLVHFPKLMTGEERIVNVQMLFGATELHMRAVNKINNDVMSEASYHFPGTEP